MKQPKYKLGDIISGASGNNVMGAIVRIDICIEESIDSGYEDTDIVYTVKANNMAERIHETNAFLLVFAADIAWDKAVLVGDIK